MNENHMQLIRVQANLRYHEQVLKALAAYSRYQIDEKLFENAKNEND
jgi:hypothetical protein